MNNTLKSVGNIGAELAAAEAEVQLEMERHRKTWRQLEQVRGLLREIEDEALLDNSTVARIQIALSQQAEPVEIAAEEKDRIAIWERHLARKAETGPAQDDITAFQFWRMARGWDDPITPLEVWNAALRHAATRPAQTEQQPVAWADPSDLHRLETGSLNCINVYREKKPCVYEPVFLRAAPIAQTALSAVTAERDRLRDQVKVLQSDANSWQSGYDKGRRDGTKHRQSEVDQLRAEVEALRKDAVAGAVVWKFIDRMGDPAECDPAETILAEFVAAFDAAMAAKEA